MWYYCDLAARMLLKLRDSTSENAAGGNAVNNIARFLTLLLIFILVLVLCYYTTRFVARTQKGKAKSGNLEILEALPLSGGKFLQLVRAGDKYLVLGVGKDNVNLLTELDKEELIPPAEGAEESFGEVFRRMWKKQAAGGAPDEGTDEDEQ